MYENLAAVHEKTQSLGRTAGPSLEENLPRDCHPPEARLERSVCGAFVYALVVIGSLLEYCNYFDFVE